jgi:hypothetical protein
VDHGAAMPQGGLEPPTHGLEAVAQPLGRELLNDLA